MINQIKKHLSMAALIIPAYAQDTSIDLKPKTGFTSLFGINVGSIIPALINILLIVVALVFFFMLVLGGIKWITSGGDEKKVAAARSQVTNALIGIVVILGAYAIMNLIGFLFGINLFSGLALPTFLPSN